VPIARDDEAAKRPVHVDDQLFESLGRDFDLAGPLGQPGGVAQVVDRPQQQDEGATDHQR
jgi:hypothetical protein